MYNKEKKRINIINIILGAIALLIIIFIIAWLIGKGRNNNSENNKVFTTNLNNMQTTAKQLFANNLPEDIGDSKLVSLKELYELELSDKLYYGKTACDEALSYISITKTAKDKYDVKTNLVCGDKIDSKSETITQETVVENNKQDETDNKVDKEDNSSNNQNSSSNSGSTNNGSTSSSNNNSNSTGCIGLLCNFVEIETECKTTFEYEYVKRKTSCPDKYELKDGVCVKETTETIPMTKEETVITEDAKQSDSKIKKVYTDYILKTNNVCASGSLQDGYCYTYTDRLFATTGSCPSGFTQDGNYCYKYANMIEETNKSCPTGFDEVDGDCVKYNYASKTNKTTKSYSCASGYIQEGTGENTKCYTTKTANKTYSEWGNPVSIYTTETKETTYEKELSMKKLLSTSTKYGVTVYRYALYERKVTGTTCSSGKLVDGVCRVYDASKRIVKTNTTSACPANYKEVPGSDLCYQQIVEELVYEINDHCPAGYSELGNSDICYIKQPLNTWSYSYCPYGTEEDANGKCYTKVEATKVDNYTCPSGYKQEGTGKNTKCYKEVTTEGKTYCENADAQLKGNKCYITVTSESCPNGYKANGKNCIKTKVETIDPIWSNVEYIYSSEKYLTGYQKTGVQKFKTVCTPVQKYK